ncbi:MAG: TRAP transporter substrate-binding protein [Burkholderiaceae bacterium]|jgi:TRAP-type mannitol/chloroaromatic compound transport system substrate-binding protein
MNKTTISTLPEPPQSPAQTDITASAGIEPSTTRRSFFRSAAIAATAAVPVAHAQSPAVAVKPSTVVLKMQGAWGAKDIFNEMAEDYVKRVNEMSGGRLRIEYLVSGSVVKPFEVTDAVSKGVLDAGHTVAVYWYGKSKVASLFGSGPVTGANAEQTLGWMMAGGGYQLYEELQKNLNLNIKGFFAFPMPTQPLGWFKKAPPKTAAELKGYKYRTVGLAADLMQELGMKVTQLPGGEIVPAMERGVIDAFEFNNPTSDSRFGAQDVAKFYAMGSYHQAMEFFEIIFNRTKYDALSPDLKAILQYASEAVSSANTWKAQDNYSKDLQKLITKDGVKVSRTSKEVFAAQIAAWDKVVAKLEAEDPFFKKVLQSQKDWARRVAYYSFFNEADYKTAYEHVFKTKLPA